MHFQFQYLSETKKQIARAVKLVQSSAMSDKEPWSTPQVSAHEEGVVVDIRPDGYVEAEYGKNTDDTPKIGRFIGATVWVRDADDNIVKNFLMGKIDSHVRRGSKSPPYNEVAMYAAGILKSKPRSKKRSEQHEGDMTPREAGFSRDASPVAAGAVSASRAATPGVGVGSSRAASPTSGRFSRGPTPAPSRGRQKCQDKVGYQPYRGEGGSGKDAQEQAEETGTSGNAVRRRSKRDRTLTPGVEDDYAGLAELTHADQVTHKNDSRRKWLAQLKHGNSSMGDMLHLIVSRFLNDYSGQKSFVLQSSIPGAGTGLGSCRDFEAGTVVALLCTSLNTHKMENQMVWYFEGTPWNKEHPEVCVGGFINSCGAEKEKENAAFFEFHVKVRNGIHTIVMVVTLRPVKQNEEFLIDYPIELEPPTLFVLTDEQRRPDMESVGRGLPDGGGSLLAGGASSRQAAR